MYIQPTFLNLSCFPYVQIYDVVDYVTPTSYRGDSVIQLFNKGICDLKQVT